MAILSAIYKNGTEEREYKKSEIDAHLYENYLKGYLYCPTENCTARLIFNSGLKSYLRTWNNDNHIEGCIHGFNRVKGRVGIDTSYFINVELSPKRKKRALKEAFNIYNMTEQERAESKKKKKQKRTTSTTISKRIKPSTNIVIDGDDVKDGEISKIGVRGPNLSKKTADTLKEKDKGKTRLLLGTVKAVNLDNEGTANIIVIENNVEVSVKFEEAFRANSPNYLGLFHHLEEYISKVKDAVFAGIGEVNTIKGDNENYSFSIFYGEDFEVNKMNLINLSAKY
ncbi:hypothetical protein [Priestia megaterium]|uniref:hypothetical protein n=1 Tax=Priestia megaterium TaxID=1404 RepID=UPI0012B6FDB9|nr:hypothetical protein [Priestia megaterium]